MTKNKIILLVCAIGVLGLGFGHDFPVHLIAAPLGVALVVGLPLVVIHALVRFVKWAWGRS